MAQIAKTHYLSAVFKLALPIALAVLSYGSVMVRGYGVLDDSDPFLHIAVGRWIISHGAVPHHDVFSHSMPGTPWVPHEWIAEIATAWIFDHLGWTGLLITTAILFALAMGLLTHALLRYLQPTYALIGVVIAWGMCFPHLLARPHVFSFPLLVAWVAALVAARNENRAPSYFAILIMLVWANVHGGYMFGLVLAGLLAAEAIFDAPDRQTRFRAARIWSLFCLMSLLATLVTPNGIAGLLLPFNLTQMNIALSSISEWKSPNFQEFQPLEAWLMLVLLGSLFLGLKLPITRIALLLILIHMALKHQRHNEILGLVAPLLIAPSLASQLPSDGRSNRFATVDSRWSGLTDTPAVRAIAVAIALLISVIATALRIGISPKEGRFFPSTALTMVARHHTTGPVFNDYNFGSYLIFSGIAPFIDGRADMYGDAFIARYANLHELPGLLERYRITWTLLSTRNPHVILLDHMPGWRRLYSDNIAVVHVRESGAAP